MTSKHFIVPLRTLTSRCYSCIAYCDLHVSRCLVTCFLSDLIQVHLFSVTYCVLQVLHCLMIFCYFKIYKPDYACYECVIYFRILFGWKSLSWHSLWHCSIVLMTFTMTLFHCCHDIRYDIVPLFSWHSLWHCSIVVMTFAMTLFHCCHDIRYDIVPSLSWYSLWHCSIVVMTFAMTLFHCCLDIHYDIVHVQVPIKKGSSHHSRMHTFLRRRVHMYNLSGERWKESILRDSGCRRRGRRPGNYAAWVKLVMTVLRLIA